MAWPEAAFAAARGARMVTLSGVDQMGEPFLISTLCMVILAAE